MKSDLNWGVKKFPLQIVAPNELLTFENRFALCREQQNSITPLSIVSKEYVPVENDFLLSLKDNLMKEFQFVAWEGKEYRNGEQVAIELEYFDDKFTAKELGGIKHTVILANSFDGKSALKLFYRPLRLVCKNGLTVPTKNCYSYKIHHTLNVHTATKEALQSLKKLINAIPKHLETFEKLSKQPKIDPILIDLFTKEFFPEAFVEKPSTRALNKLSRFEASLYHGVGQDMPKNDWWLYNGFTYFIDHTSFLTSGRSDQEYKAYYGSGQKEKEKALDFILAFQ